jgi:hypothetical protein
VKRGNYVLGNWLRLLLAKNGDISVVTGKAVNVVLIANLHRRDGHIYILGMLFYNHLLV